MEKRIGIVCFLLVSCLPLAGQETGRRVSQPLPIVGNVNHVPLENKCRSGVMENPQTHDLFYQTKGVTVFNDGYEAVHSLYQGAFHSKKEMQKQRRKALKECADWLDHIEGK